MNKIYILILFMLTNLNAISYLEMSEVGSTKSVSQSCVNSTCAITLNAGSQLYFQIKNTTNKNLVLTKFELIKTYNGQDVVESSTSDSTLLGRSFKHNDSVSLGYNLVYNTTANYWTGKYYLLDTDTGEKFTNSLKWNNAITNNSVVAVDITENKINVSNVEEFRAALTTAASDGKDTIIYLDDGNYTTTEDGLGQFQYFTSQNHTLTIKGSNRDNVILSGENTTRVLYLSGGKEFHLENITIEKGYVNGDGGGIFSNKDVYLKFSMVRDNNLLSTGGNWGGGIYDNYYIGNIYVWNSLIENNSCGAGKGGGFYTNNAEVRNSVIRYNEADEGGGFYSEYAQVYNSIIDSNAANGTIVFDKGGAFYVEYGLSVVNSLIINNKKGISTYNPDAYVVNSIFTENSEYDIGDSGGSFHISNSYLDGNLSATHFDDNLITSGNLGFVDADNHNYRLTPDSILVDAGTIGNNAVDIPLLDMDGYKRVAGASIDIGPYELSSTRPTLYTLSYNGNAEEFSKLTFNITYALDGNRTLDNIAYDYNNNGIWTTNNTYIFNTAGTYTVKVKVTDSAGEFSTKSQIITIAPLAFNNMTDEQKLKKAIDPAYYNDIIALIDTEKSSSHDSGVTMGENSVTTDPNSYGLHTQAEFDTAISDANTSAYEAGKQYVQNNLSEFNLTTQTAMNTALADMNSTATASGRDMVLSSPSGYGLVSTSDLNSSVAQALTNGITQGKQYVQNNLSEFNLTTQTAMNTALADMNSTATASGIASGKAYVQTNPSEFNLTTITAMNTAIADANTTAVSDTMAKCSANPSSCGIDLSTTENITTEYINNLDTGWTLTGTAKNITDLTVFESAKTVWIYSNGSWSAYSSNQTTQQAIKDANINILTSISANSGIWVLK